MEKKFKGGKRRLLTKNKQVNILPLTTLKDSDKMKYLKKMSYMVPSLFSCFDYDLFCLEIQ